MEFRILGPLEAWTDGRQVRLAGAKQRALLGLLIVRRNQVVSADRLIDDLWGDHPLGSPAAALQMRVSALRKALEGHGARAGPSETLITRAPGYLLRVESGGLDADRFDALLRDGREALAAGQPEVAAAALEEALLLWRGEPFADLADEPFVQAEIARLSEGHLAAIEERIEADLALGRHRECSVDLKGLVGVYPLRERLRGQLMVALYRSGRQAEALAVYGDTRRALQEELGIEPGPGLQRLEIAVLNQDVSLEPPILAPVQERLARPTERRKTVTVVVGELSVVRSQGPIDPEFLRRVGERHFDVARQIVDRHGGTLDPRAGEAFLAVFGVPGAREDDAIRALRAAEEVRAAVQQAEEDPLRTSGARIVARVGVATGEVIATDSTPGRPLVVGEPVQLARRLARMAASGEILLGDVTKILAEDWASVELAEGGEHEPHGWRLLGLEAQRREGHRPESPLVGRARELDQLAAAFDRAVREQGVVLCTILGQAGIGKSRLVQEFVATVEGRARVLTGRCLAYGEGITFWPLNEIVWQAAPDGEIAALLSGDDQAGAVAQRLAGAIGLAEAQVSVEETFWAVRRLFEAMARAVPLVVIIEDIHWAESTLLGLIEYLAAWTRESPILLLCIARPELLEVRPSWGAGRTDATTIGLGPLADSESALLLEAQPGGKRLGSATRRLVQNTAEGNPFFLEQIAAMVADSAHNPGGDLPVPPTIEAVLTARLERLGPGERAVLDRAAVMGKEFWPGAVAELLPEEARTSLPRYLDVLVRKDFLRPIRSKLPGEEEFRFRHVLIQQSAYGSIPKAVRPRLHEKFGIWLEERAGSRLAEVDELVGYHLEQAFLGRAEASPMSPHDSELGSRAAERLATAGRRAFGRGDMPASVNLLERASALLQADDAKRLDLLSDLAFALFEVGELERSDRVLAEVVDRGTAIHDRRAVARAKVKLMHVEFYTHPENVDQKGSLRDVARAMAVLRLAGDNAGLARAWTLISEIRWISGHAGDAEKASALAARHAHRAGSRRDEAWSLGSYGFDILFGPRPVAAGIRDLERRLRDAEGDPVLDANLTGFLAPLEAMEGRIADARARISSSQQVTIERGLRWQSGTQDLLGAFIELLADDPAAAESHLLTAVETFQATGDVWFLEFAMLELAHALCVQARNDEALATIERFDALPAESGVSHRLRRSYVLGRLLARRGDHDAARVCARAAVRIAEQTDFTGFQADAQAGLAEVLRLAGRNDGEIVALRRAIELYERKGNLVEATRARARLAGRTLTAADEPSTRDAGRTP